jgi:Zn-finger nucleic acid-binding protein
MPDVHASAGGATMETRWPCPVCLGVAMQKTTVRSGGTSVTLDVCPRCAGIWFERGEARQLAHQSPEALWKEVPRHAEPIRPPCHGCAAPIDRDVERCPACGHRNVLRCPHCDLEMERRAHGGLVLDLCRRCEGVWFDHAELAAIWQLNLSAATQRAQRRAGRGEQALAVGGDVLLNALFWTPDLVVYGAAAATRAATGAVGSLGSVGVESIGGAAAEAASSAAEVVGSAAEGVFSMIADIIGSLFDG